MSKTTGNTMPMVKCPHCGQTIQVEDWYKFSGDNEAVECSCGQTMYCTATETVMYATFSTEPEG